MKTDARRLSAAPIALAAALLTAFLVLVSPLAASAHDSLISSSPEAGSTVDTLPTELTLTFSAKLIDAEGATEVVVTDAAGESVTDGPATVNGAIVTQPLMAEAEAGDYTVLWRVVSSDGHPISEEFSFTVANSTESTSSPEPTSESTAQPTAEPTAAAPTATAGPGTDVSPSPEAEETSPSTVMIWVLAIAGVLVIVGIIVWLVIRGRRGPGTTDSVTPTER